MYNAYLFQIWMMYVPAFKKSFFCLSTYLLILKHKVQLDSVGLRRGTKIYAVVFYFPGINNYFTGVNVLYCRDSQSLLIQMP